MEDTETKILRKYGQQLSSKKFPKVFLNVPKTCFSFLSFTVFCKISTVQSKPLNF